MQTPFERMPSKAEYDAKVASMRARHERMGKAFEESWLEQMSKPHGILTNDQDQVVRLLKHIRSGIGMLIFVALILMFIIANGLRFR